ncbi:hypothetical protein AMS68_001631 [Peltaster fructicola]|uniref:GST C-terminal domain-containing protein n=1 Tax=Peltaster fructicola TaxID=286661 RepID=A0A6H0XN13_9PEZI|nr:hypothetical protein AMS68_001631 [Peltaster fructicola]
MAPVTSDPHSHPEYELLYHPQIPGRGEFIRLAFEAVGVSYTDVANDKKDGYSEVQSICMNDEINSSDGNPPILAPPALRVPGAGPDGTALILAQTPNILFYLGEKLGLVSTAEADKYHTYQLVLTALDLNNEIHDSHHPIAPSAYYEDQSAEALKKAADVRNARLPKFFSYFERSLQHNHTNGGGKFLIGGRLSIADTTVWQVLDGAYFAFPNEMAARKAEYPELLDTFYNSVKQEPHLKQYLASGRRRAYGMGVFRHYPELDRQA